MSERQKYITPLEWVDGKVRFLDQTLLPEQERYTETEDVTVIADAIRRLGIRGAPLIGIAAAYGVVLAMSRLQNHEDALRSEKFEKAVSLLGSTRPTAVNLFWSLRRMRNVFERHRHDTLDVLQNSLVVEAQAIHGEDSEMCRKIGEHGARLLPSRTSVLTHCNTGRLATGGIGTALGVIETAWELQKISHVYIGETRPLLQGVRLTAWELGKLNIPATLIVDSVAGFLMQRGKVSAVIVGADRIAANGDVANKVGTYALAVLAKHHNVPFYVAAPSSSLDFDTPSGDSMTIELRGMQEVAPFFETYLSLRGVDVFNPAFDLTPHDFITALITEQGVVERPTLETLAKWQLSNRGVKSPVEAGP